VGAESSSEFAINSVTINSEILKCLSQGIVASFM
jgi:hypothetical protein